MIRVITGLPMVSPSSGTDPEIRPDGDALYIEYPCAGLESWAIVRFDGLLDWHFGYPNDEALDSHPLYSHGLQPYRFHEGPVGTFGERCWVITFHDGTLTVFAKSIAVVSESQNPSAGITIEHVPTKEGQ